MRFEGDEARHKLLCFATIDPLFAARNQMAISLGAHIVLACFGMALPAMIFVLHRRGLAGDADALELAKRWSKVSGVLFAIGAASGTILSFEMGLLWPGLMETYGDVIGLPFALEGISFFTEAIFLGIYLYGWGKLPGNVHSLMLLPIMAAGIAGSFFVCSVNAWMNAPIGFDLVTAADGTVSVTNVDPLRAMFNDAAGIMFAHMFLAAYAVAGFSAASVYAVGLLRGRDDRHHRVGLAVPLAFASVAALGQPLVGHFAGQRVADHQPIKLAAMEGAVHTETGAPMLLGGVYRDGELTGAIEVPIPGLASFLAQNDFDAEIPGLETVPEEDRPPLNVVRFAFQIMVGLGTALAALALWSAWRWRKGLFASGTPLSRPFLVAVALSGAAAIAAMETGWITTEVGRQPWVVHGLMRTEEAVTDSGYIVYTLIGLVVVYAIMGIAGIGILRSMARRWARGDHDLASPYGPAELVKG